jgi:adenine-specific DNA-methyltransferase
MDEIKPEILSDNSETTINSQQIETLKKHFPQCFDKDGNFIAEKLNEIVSDSGTALSKESYGLNWLGKSYARLLANENPLTLLAEDKTHNQKPENKDSQNLLIKGDNLEVLKHLKGAYSESIKMIYIDPPYNTGSDGFVYQDDRKFTPEQLSELAGIETEEAKRILEFTQSKANSHSAWLTFMYPRLYIAHELLKDEGVIFISIDDNELAQLQLLCNEIFGEANFIASLVWEKKKKGTFLSKSITNVVENILVFSKDREKFDGLIGELNSNEETYPCINASNQRDTRLIPKGIPSKFKEKDYFLPKGEVISDTTMSIELHSDLVIENGLLKNDLKLESNWRYTQENMDKYAEEGCLYITRDLYIRRIVKETRYKTLKDLLPRIGDDSTSSKEIDLNNLQIGGWGSNEDGEEEVRVLLSKDVFTNPKPSKLLIKLIASTRFQDEIILDFFAGSGTTAHAVMDLNKADNGNRKFICVQLPEETEKSKAAYKAGYKTIFEITKARIEKAAEKIRAENPDYNGDLGFQIFETLPIFEGYLDNIDTLEGEIQDLFDGATLTDEQLEHLLTTWKVYDGIPLTQPLIETDLAGYTAFRHEKVLYLMHQGFKTESLKEFLSKLDTTTGTYKDFDVEKFVLFGYNFDSKNQLEINEAVRQYQNRKEKNVSVVVRY